tara:strand:- start:22 stop:171 length:150 start_codon:yes stop_codon:yes gene_type:complete
MAIVFLTTSSRRKREKERRGGTFIEAHAGRAWCENYSCLTNKGGAALEG